MKTVKVTGFSIPLMLLQTIDDKRGDVPRSRFVSRLIADKFREFESSDITTGGEQVKLTGKTIDFDSMSNCNLRFV